MNIHGAVDVLVRFVNGMRRWWEAQIPIQAAAGGPPATTASTVTMLDGAEVALEVLQAMSYRGVLKNATIVSYNMQDYDFWGHGSLSHLLLRQLSLGASIRLMTTPPPGRPTNNTFKNKYALLRQLVNNGIAVYLNEKLHAKAYLFLDTKEATTAIVGSVNLTEHGFGLRSAAAANLVEMAAFSEDRTVFQIANDFVDRKIVGDSRTEDFATWFARNSAEIGKAGL